MDIFTLNQFLSLYSWFPLVVVLSIYLLIARFYQRFSGKRTLYWLFAAPMILYGVAFVRYASVDRLAGDVWGDAFGAAGGLVLVILSTFLFYRMMNGQQP